MKLLPWVPPVIALLAVGWWILPGGGPASEVDRTSVDHSRKTARDSSGTSAAERLRVDPMTADWKLLAEEVRRSFGVRDARGLQATKALKARIGAMSWDELAEVFSGIPEDGWDAKAKSFFQQSLIRGMAVKDPVRCLDFLGEQVASGGYPDHEVIAEVLMDASATDPEKAVAWLDQAIESGKLDSILRGAGNQKWMDYESALIAGLLKGNPAAAEQRLAGFSTEVREEMLAHDLWQRTPVRDESEVTVAYLGVCRCFLSEEEFIIRVNPIAGRAMERGGLTGATAFLDRIKATRAERAAVVSSTALDYLDHVARSRVPVLSDVEAVRNWAREEGATDVDRITGEALGKLAGHESFGTEQALTALSVYQGSGANDALLTGFLSRPAVWSDPARCRELAGRIRDGELRASHMNPPQ